MNAAKGTSGRPPQGVGASRKRRRQGAAGYLERHLQVLIHALGRLSRTPLSTLMTTAVIGIALALPAGLYLLVDHARALGGEWRETTRISLFLKEEVTDEQARRLRERLVSDVEVEETAYISPEQALEEFRELSGFGEVLDALDRNPLPGVVTVQPAANLSPEAIQSLRERLQEVPEVELAQLDMEWVRRLYTLLDILQRGILTVAVLLALAVLLIVGNTIRLDIESRREEIVITKLIGGTDGFIRRPFLYTGFWYGLGGAVIALLLVNLSLALLQGPVEHLAGLYGSDFRLGFTSPEMVLTVLGIGVALGLLGALLAVGRHLHAIEPE